MSHKVHSSALVGIDAVPVSVQIDSNPGLHSFTIVGLGDKAVQESIDRIDAAIKHCGFKPPRSKNRRFIINLAPADLKKEGPGYDLPIAIAYLLETNQLSCSEDGFLLLGELGLDGQLAHTNGILATTMMARDTGATSVIVPYCNKREADMVSGIVIRGANSLSEVVSYLSPLSPGATNLAPGGDTTSAKLAPGATNLALTGDSVSPVSPVASLIDDSFAYIKGQQSAKRALVVAAAGGHNVLMSGAPGSGKTLLARALIGILPPLTAQESIEVAKIHSAAGLLRGPAHEVTRPFWAPHHTSSSVSVVGGGTHIRPGQVSLAHRGILFLDEMPEFARNVLEALRQPLEDGVVTVSRASGTLILPAKFMLVGAMNPCPCGNAGDAAASCICAPAAILKYVKKISGPLLDRMDIQLFVARERLGDDGPADVQNLSRIRESISAARSRQSSRFIGTALVTNSEISHRTISHFCDVEPTARRLLRDTVNRRGLSLRAYHKVQKVARTIADLDDKVQIGESHIAEALALRISGHISSDA